MLSICNRCHDYGHDHDASFVVWCLMAKLKKGELDIPLLDRLKRGASLMAALERRELFIDERTADMAERVKESVGENYGRVTDSETDGRDLVAAVH